MPQLEISPLADPNTGLRGEHVPPNGAFSLPLPAYRQERSGVELGEDDLVFIHVTCVVCARGHLVNPKTGRVPGAGEDTIGA